MGSLRILFPQTLSSVPFIKFSAQLSRGFQWEMAESFLFLIQYNLIRSMILFYLLFAESRSSRGTPSFTLLRSSLIRFSRLSNLSPERDYIWSCVYNFLSSLLKKKIPLSGKSQNYRFLGRKIMSNKGTANNFLCLKNINKSSFAKSRTLLEIF